MKSKNLIKIKFIAISVICTVFLMSTTVSCCTLAKKAVDSIIVEKDTVSTDTYPPEESTTSKAVASSSETNNEISSTDSTISENALTSEKVKSKFQDFTNGDPDYFDIFGFMDNNISSADTSLADEIIDYAFTYSKNNLEIFTDNYADNDIQEKLWNDYGGETDLYILKASSDADISDLATETLGRRYKIISVEGFIMPLMDYKAYQSYSNYLSNQMNDYIRIMAAESERPSVMDMGITISLEEYVLRIIPLYKFKDTYPDFKRITEIKNMLSGKLWVYMGGIDNTPVFDFDENIIQERLDDFKANEIKYEGTEFGLKLKEYLNLLADENFVRTQAVMDYLDSL